MFTGMRYDLGHHLGERNTDHLHRAGYGTGEPHGYTHRDFGRRRDAIGDRHDHDHGWHCQARFKRSGLWQSALEAEQFAANDHVDQHGEFDTQHYWYSDHWGEPRRFF
jgi:hypothetical protein